ncbi:hypothetical protein ACETK8_15835 [Brevundimonas staleyi]|uniref:Uncharacterized protein n=1 Tax=Brevundimonas staleyi TaxID=74326 RepID=A0ABW0FZS8_9CAUL
MNTPALPGLAPAVKRGPGRPKGSGNKRSGDLQRYVEAVYGGMTPGQQSAQIGLVTAKELRDAGGDLMMAMAVKARGLAAMLGCEGKEAWLLMQRERADLLPYIHQKRGQKEEAAPGDVPTHTYVAIPMEAGTAAGDGQGAGEWDTPPDLLEYQSVSDDDAKQVTEPKSPDDA